MPRFKIDSPKGVHVPPGKYSHAARAEGPLIVLAGQVALDIDGELVGENDVAAQTRQVFRNMSAVLAGSGTSYANVVEFTYYIVGRENVQGFMECADGHLRCCLPQRRLSTRDSPRCGRPRERTVPRRSLRPRGVVTIKGNP